MLSRHNTLCKRDKHMVLMLQIYTIFKSYFFLNISVIAQEKTVQNIEKFNRNSLKHAETQEKQTLPTKEGWYYI